MIKFAILFSLYQLNCINFCELKTEYPINDNFLTHKVALKGPVKTDDESEPEPPVAPECRSSSRSCREQWDDYSEREREYQRAMDDWCEGKIRLSCRFRF